MKELPIIFSAPMVRAILDGTKTQTRREAKLTSSAHVKEVGGNRRWHPEDPEATLACPYGKPGDRLWVRETFIQGWSTKDDGCLDQFDEAGDEKPIHTWYRATDDNFEWADDDGGWKNTPWKPSIHMPRSASRITLEITGVRVERLNEISSEDVTAEGVKTTPNSGLCMRTFKTRPGYEVDGLFSNMEGAHTQAFKHLWESIKGPGSWDENPWVWVIEFKKMEAV